MQAPGATEPHGRGLRVVDALSEEWGVSPSGDEGKTVWFRILLQRPSSNSSTTGDPDAANFELIDQNNLTHTPEGSVIVANDSVSDGPNSFRRGFDPRFRARTRGATSRRRTRSTH